MTTTDRQPVRLVRDQPEPVRQPGPKPTPEPEPELQSFLHIVYRALKMVTAYLEKVYHF